MLCRVVLFDSYTTTNNKNVLDSLYSQNSEFFNKKNSISRIIRAIFKWLIQSSCGGLRAKYYNDQASLIKKKKERKDVYGRPKIVKCISYFVLNLKLKRQIMVIDH